MPDSPASRKKKFDWPFFGTCLTLCIALGLSAITTIGTNSSQSFSTIGSSIASGGNSWNGYGRSIVGLFDGGRPEIHVAPPAAQPAPVPQAPQVATQLPPEPTPNTESYTRHQDSPFLRVSDAPLSTFSVDVDTASYSNVRRFLRANQLPPRDAVRVEELINYFEYDYPSPAGEHPVALLPETAACPWDPDHRLVRLAVQARRIDSERLPPRNLVFLIDVSGSMAAPERLPLVKTSLRLLVGQLTGRDRVAIVVYAGDAGLWLPATPGNEKARILDAIQRLNAAGSTNGGEGIIQAYRVARENFIDKGVNRVILATDGDFNVGVTSQEELVRLIEEQRRTGVFLTCLGYGMGNYKDATIQKLADHGNGHHAYIDTEDEARKVFVAQGAALVPVAKDVKIQVEFNPRQVEAYRLIGYEKRLLRDRDFNDDRKDAGDMGAGHQVTALYEIVPASPSAAPAVDPLKYQDRPSSAPAEDEELLTVKLRCKEPDGERSRLLTQTVKGDARKPAAASTDFRFAAAVAAYGMILRDSPERGRFTLADVRELAAGARGLDGRGYRAEFLSLVERADQLMNGRRDGGARGLARE